MTKEIETIKTQISIGGFNGSRSLMPNNIDEAYRIATAFSRSDFIPKEYRGNADNCFCAINLGMEIGLPPMRALQSIAVVNGKPSIYGDAQLALVRNSGKLTHFKEYYDGEEGKDNFAAVCEIKREGDSEITIEKFSIADAKKANLWGKSGPWTTHPKRMMRYKARAFALRDKFADVLLGLTHSVEEMQGEILDVTPPSPETTPNQQTFKNLANNNWREDVATDFPGVELKQTTHLTYDQMLDGYKACEALDEFDEFDKDAKKSLAYLKRYNAEEHKKLMAIIEDHKLQLKLSSELNSNIEG